MAVVEFPSLELEVAFLRGLVSVTRMADDILEDCLERGLALDAALDIFLTQCARMVHASAGFVVLRGSHGPVLTRVHGEPGVNLAEVAGWKGPLQLTERRMLFCTRLTLGQLDFGVLGLVVEGRFDDGGKLVMKLVEAIGEQLDSSVLAFLALADGTKVQERLDELQPADGLDTEVKRGRIGRYEVLSTLGTGGMAQVLVARTRGPEGLGRLVALKRILPHLASEKVMVDQFLDEARIALRLSHANLVTVHDFGEAHGSYFIAMELVRGVDLHRLLRAHGPLEPSLAVAAVSQGLQGLHAAHQLRGEDGVPLQLVHRDMSPHNLMVGFDGRVKVLDFGVAKARAQRTVTLPGIVKGKPLYMSPEQARGRRLDARSDLFAMGVILYEALSGTRAFDRGSELASLEAICVEPVAPSERIPPALWEVLEVALAKSPEGRYRDAQEMARALVEACPPARDAELGKLASTRFPDRLRDFLRMDRTKTG
ncbi:serine/threonine-protein kinase [Myxococcaceae bacterium GXIMD 01537]